MMLTERSVELPWLISHIGRPESLLDIGSADAAYLPMLYELCRNIALCDTRQFQPPIPCTPYIGPAHTMPDEWNGVFDLVTCVSTLDHVGLDAYGNTAANEDLLEETVAAIHRVLKPGGRLLVTVPFGRPVITNHPGGAQRVFDFAQIHDMFTGDRWSRMAPFVWRVRGSIYVEADIQKAADAEYLGWRAEAVIALEIERK